MKKFDKIHCTIMSAPVVEMESPYYLTFDVKVQGDVVQATFVGDFARALKNNILVGGQAIIRNGLVVEHGKLVFDFMHLEPHTATGRNVDTIC